MADSRSEVSREGYQRCQHGTEVLFELLAVLIRPGMSLLWHFVFFSDTAAYEIYARALRDAGPK